MPGDDRVCMGGEGLERGAVHPCLGAAVRRAAQRTGDHGNRARQRWRVGQGRRDDAVSVEECGRKEPCRVGEIADLEPAVGALAQAFEQLCGGRSQALPLGIDLCDGRHRKVCAAIEHDARVSQAIAHPFHRCKHFRHAQSTLV